MNALAGWPDILPLIFAVTYWDQLDWKDTFARPEYTNRQVAYGHKFGDGAYTPEVVINGKVGLVGADRSQLHSAIAKAPPLHGPTVTLATDTVGMAVRFSVRSLCEVIELARQATRYRLAECP